MSFRSAFCCCRGRCLIQSSDAYVTNDWVAVTGAWTDLTTSDDPALLRSKKRVAPDTVAVYAHVTILATEDGEWTGLALGIVPASPDTFWWVKATWGVGMTDDVIPLPYGTLELFERVAGVDTQHGPTLKVTNLNAGSGIDWRLQLCFETSEYEAPFGRFNAALLGDSGSGFFGVTNLMADASFDPADTAAGLMAGAISLVVFDDFYFARHRRDTYRCYNDCFYCLSCDDGEESEELQIVIAGVASQPFVICGDDTTCEDLNSTWIVERTGTCRWTYPGDLPCVYDVLQATFAFGVLAVSLSSTTPELATEFRNLDVYSTCTEWVDVELEPFAPVDTVCDLTGALMTVTSL